MTETEALRIFKSIRLYFAGSYDITKYGLNGINVSEREYHKYRYFVRKAKKKFNTKEFIEYCVSNVLSNTEFGDVVNIDQTSLMTYYEWKKHNSRFTNEFKSDIIAIRDEFLTPQNLSFNDLFKVEGTHPLILKMLLGGDINSETFIAINEVLNFYDAFDEKLDNDYIWTETRDRMLKYKKFLKIDNNIIKGIMKDVYTTK